MNAGRVEAGRVYSRAEFAAQGLSARSIDQSARTGALHRLRRGRYVDGPAWRRLSRLARHALLVTDLAPGRSGGTGGAVVSHFSAAVLHGLVIPSGADLSRVHLTWPGSAGRAPTSNLSPHRAVIDPAEIIDINGIGVTHVARTLFDVARSEDQLLSVPVADAALGDGRCDRADLALTLDRAAGRPGSSFAGQVMAFADPRAATVMQSQARVLMARAGLPVPGLAVTIDHPWGWRWAPSTSGLPSWIPWRWSSIISIRFRSTGWASSRACVRQVWRSLGSSPPTWPALRSWIGG